MLQPVQDSADERRLALADELLAVRCLLGEADAFDELVDRWHEPLWRYLRGVLPDEQVAADAVQDTWLRVLRSLPRLRDPARLRAFLFGVARRAAMDRLRDRYAQRITDTADALEVADPLAETDADLLAELDAEEQALQQDALQATLRKLPVIEREVLVLFYLQELSLRQISEVQQVPLGTVKSRLHRARRMLRDRMPQLERSP